MGLLVMAAFLASACAGETLRVSSSALAPATLREAVGVLSLFPQPDAQEALQTYRPRQQGYAPLRSLDVAALVPLSELRDGVQAPTRRYLVTGLDGDMARVVTNPVTGGALWLDLAELRRSSWSAELVRLDDLAQRRFLLDPFLLWPSETRPVCPAPGLMGDCRALGRGGLLAPIEQRGDYVRVAVPSPDGSPAKTLGWVPVHDDDGRLSLWLTQ